MVENDKVRNTNGEASTALRKGAKATKSSIPSPYESIIREIDGSTPRPLVKEVCLSIQLILFWRKMLSIYELFCIC